MKSGVETSLEETKYFFLNLKKYIEDQIQFLENNAQAESRFISVFIDKVAQVNIDYILHSIEKRFVNPSKPALSDEQIVLKLQGHTERALKFLEAHNSIVQKGAYFIPIPFHKKQAPITNKIVEDCRALLVKLKAQNATPILVKKTWLSHFLDLAHRFIAIRTIAFGLDKKPRFGMTSEQIEEGQKAALDQFNDMRKEIAAFAQQSPKLTKKSQNILQCDSYHDKPKAPVCFQYCPENISDMMLDFEKLMISTSESDLTKSMVHDKLRLSPK